MGNSKAFILIVVFVTFATHASATPEKFGGNSQKIDRAFIRKLELAQHFMSDGEGSNDGEKTNRMLEKLNLSAQQSRQVTAIRKRFKTERNTLYQQVKTHRQEMRTLLATDTSSDRLRQNYQETRSLLERLGSNRFEMIVQIRKILTTEQRIILIDWIGQDRN
ncbi:MAG: periplasmic heavy metal sensor [Cyanobacteria bacterium P01_A01_bin.40]